ncbi:MAG: DNA polymerase III subunit gamma/tau [Bacteroidetes bacterium]|nr:DNA polymerase III subunit gamma/tau [Bacteroidota bacterium]MBS1642019.1 DNA polymerase III subunit gamma/tau [Bacteroidota bacterium]MBS1670488.1 DNA polymerase III subunit gamma/tau [Bacteroidota bacterium]
MDKFIVSARKYRPQNFNTVVGQSHITTTLKNAIQHNQLAHAFLFCGPRGVGKTTCARILAKTINCENLQPDGEACNQCNSCKSFNDGASLNIHELDAASNNSVDDIRSLVEQVRFAPQAGKYKVYIIDEVHMLTASAFNAFLKTLEEPPAYAIFILATTEKHKILPTILSRCQIFDFKRITTNDTVEHLEEIIAKENIEADKQSLHVIAQKSEGCMRDALSILDKIVSFSNGKVNYKNTLEHLNILDEDYYFKLLEHLQQQNLTNAMLLYDEINNKGFEGDLVLNGFAEFLRNVLVSKDAKAAVLLDVAEGMHEKFALLSKNISLSYIISALNILNEAEINFKMARNKRLHVELTLIKLNFLQQAIDLSLNEQGSVVKKKQLDAQSVIKFKSIQPIEIKKVTEARLLIEKPKEEIKKQLVTNQNIETKNIVAEPVSSYSKQPITSNGNKKDLLNILREKAGRNYTVQEVKEAVVLSEEKLLQCWNEYIIKLEKQGGKPSTVSTFRLAKINIIDELKFTVSVNAITQQKFIEQEKMMLADHLQQTFNNRAINFSVIVEEGEQIIAPQQVMLNSKQRFERIAEQYPLLRELKDKLKLEIDY